LLTGGMPDPELPLPTPDLIERARAFQQSGQPTSPAKPSATVVLLRDGRTGLEVFMIRRLAAMAFAGGMHVFPGGVVDPADETPVVTAIRETFEECGVLLATGDPTDPTLLEADRLALIEHRATLADVLSRHSLTADTGCLRRWSRWITPDFEPRRYDTHFFVAITPPGQDARDMGGESDAAEWVTPATALAAAQRQEWLLMPPTETTLRELLPYRSASEAFEAAAHRVVRPRLASIDLAADPPVFFFRTTT
jgi:8-oxo-dGTP pyrophosphatase MutT (NUDIX family)